MRFSSKRIDPDTGFYYYSYRFYDPNTMRWLNRDPAEEFYAENVYSFSDNDGINIIDPFGLWGAGFQCTGGGEAGVIWGAGATGSAGIGYFSGNKRGVGGYFSGGAFIGGPGWHKSFPKSTKAPFAIGYSAGGGPGLFFTNAKKSSELGGPFDQINVNLSVIPSLPGLSFSIGNSGATWIGSIGVSFGPPGASISGFPTTTWAW
jgi:RHS repeat-associated protein